MGELHHVSLSPPKGTTKARTNPFTDLLTPCHHSGPTRHVLKLLKSLSPVSRLMSNAASSSPSLWASPTGRDFVLRSIQKLVGMRGAALVPLAPVVQMLLVGGKLNLDVLTLLTGKEIPGDPDVVGQLLSGFAFQYASQHKADWADVGGETYVHASVLLLTAVERDLRRVSQGCSHCCTA